MQINVPFRRVSLLTTFLYYSKTLAASNIVQLTVELTQNEAYMSQEWWSKGSGPVTGRSLI